MREAEHLGFRSQETRHGIKILAHDGQRWAMVHWTPSDRRAIKNFRADLKRIGVFDGVRR